MSTLFLFFSQPLTKVELGSSVDDVKCVMTHPNVLVFTGEHRSLTIFAESYEGSASFVKVLGGEPEFAETAEAKYGRGQIRLAQECFGIGVQPDGGEDIDDAGKPNA